MKPVSAARLGIEIVADIARLQQDLDAAKRLVRQASGDIASSTRAANDNIAGLNAGFARTPGLSKQAAFGLRNAAYQAQDLGVQLFQASQSSDPLRMAMMALVMQGPQIKDALNQTGMSATQLGLRFVRAHPYLVGFGIAAGAAAVALGVLTSKLEKDADIEGYAASLGLTAKEMKKLENVGVTFGDVMVGVWKTMNDAWGLSDMWESFSSAATDAFIAVLKSGKDGAVGLYAGFMAAYDTITALWDKFPDVLGDAFITAVNAAIQAIEDLVNRSIDSINDFAARAESLLGGIDLFGEIGRVDYAPLANAYAGAGREAADHFERSFNERWAAGQATLGELGDTLTKNIVGATEKRLAAQAAEIRGIEEAKRKRDRHAEALAREAAATEALIRGLYKVTDAYLQSSAAGLRAEIVAEAIEKGIKKQADLRAYVARQIRLAAAERTAEAAKEVAQLRDQTDALRGLNDQVAAGSITSEVAQQLLERENQLRPYIVAMALAEGEAKQKLAEVIEQLRKEQGLANDEARRAQELQEIERLRDQATLIKAEIDLTRQLGEARLEALGGLAGYELEEELARLSAEHERATIIMHAQIEAGRLAALGMHDYADEIMRVAAKEAELVGLEHRFEAEERAIARANAELRDMLGMLSDLADLAGLDSFGAFVFRLDDTDFGHEFLKDLKRTLDRVFGGEGSFNKALSALGLAVEANRMIGDIFGFKGGPLGILTGLVDDIINPSRTARAHLTGPHSIGLGGKDRGNYDAAGDLAGSVIEGLRRIADQLGASIGSFSTTIGTRGGEFRVNPNGTSLKVGEGALNFGDDAEAAVAAAIADAIRDGALQGLRAGAQALLNAGGDLEEQLSKALTFQSVFDELEKAKDPFGFAMKGLDAEFERLRKIFAEAGASEAAYAQLEELYGIRRNELLEQYAAEAEDVSRRREMEIALMQAQGRETEALSAARQYELSQLPESLRALQEMIYAAQDAAAAQQKAAELLRTRRDMEIALQEALGNSGHALKLRRELELAAMDESLRALQLQIYAAQDAAAAQEELARAQAAAAAEAQRMASLQVRLYEAQGNDAAALSARRAMELAEATAAERAMLEQIYAAEDAARLAQDAAAAREAAAREAEQRAQERARLAEQRGRLEVELMRALGNETGALARQRQLELAAMDGSLRALQRQVWAAQDAAEAARKFGDLSRSLRDFRSEIMAGEQAAADAYREAQVKFMTVSALARAGDETAIGGLRDAGSSFLAASRERASSWLQYQRDLSAVLRAVDDTLDYTDGQVDIAQRQLDAIADNGAATRQVRDEIAALRRDLNTALGTVAANTRKAAAVLEDAADGRRPIATGGAA